ncbi:MAG: hypothetical protein RLZ22_995 [Verrucomicrobiota bacterium]|jgi:hypothetical protein
MVTAVMRSDSSAIERRGRGERLIAMNDRIPVRISAIVPILMPVGVGEKWSKLMRQ